MHRAILVINKNEAVHLMQRRCLGGNGFSAQLHHIHTLSYTLFTFTPSVPPHSHPQMHPIHTLHYTPFTPSVLPYSHTQSHHIYNLSYTPFTPSVTHHSHPHLHSTPFTPSAAPLSHPHLHPIHTIRYTAFTPSVTRHSHPNSHPIHNLSDITFTTDPPDSAGKDWVGWERAREN